MAEVVATYAVHAGTTQRFDLDDVTDPSMVALWLIEDATPDLDVCHECADRVVDLEAVTLTAFTVAGVTYEYDDETRQWAASGGGGDRG